VVPFVRRTSDLRGIEGLGLVYAYGNVIDRAALMVAAEHCNVIVHSAAVHRWWAKDRDEIMRPAMKGTENIISVAKEMELKRVVYTSSLIAVGSSIDPSIVLTEDDWNVDAKSPYTVAKTRSERHAWGLAEEAGIAMIALLPACVLGPYDYRVTPSTDIVLGLLNGTRPTIETGFSVVDVRDVGEIHARAVEGGEPGQRYIISGEDLINVDLGKIVADLTGVAPDHVGLGRGALMMFATGSELAARMKSSEPAFSRDYAYEYCNRYQFVNGSKAANAFDLEYRPVRNTISETIRWLLFIGKIRPEIAQDFKEQFPPNPEWSSMEVRLPAN
jgi:dihydroflavonol-4-reductase